MLMVFMLEKAVILGEGARATTLLDIATAFPSVDREWVWAVMGELGLPEWVQCAMLGIVADSGAAVYHNGAAPRPTCKSNAGSDKVARHRD